MRSRELSSLDEIIARNPEDAEKTDKDFAEKFADQNWELFKEKNELIKSEEQIRIIDLVDKETDKLREKYDLKKLNVSPSHVHLFRSKNYIDLLKNKIKNPGFSSGIFHPQAQTIITNQKFSSPKLMFANTAFHEITHLKFKNVAYVTKDGIGLGEMGISGDFNPESNETKSYFENLNEAITEELTMRFKKNILKNHPDFQNDFKLIDEFVEQEKKAGRDIDRDEVNGAIKTITYSADNKKEFVNIKAIAHSYREGRDALNLLIDKLYGANMNKFRDPEEVFELFAKSAFTGNIVGKGSWGRLVDETFGPGTLKKIAEKDAGLDKKNVLELKKFIESLEAI